MNSFVTTPAHAAGAAFDGIAADYDQVFTNSVIGRAQRDAVWNVAASVFSPGSRILELNCGTGEDALFLSRLGMKVYACDASENMIAVAKKRQLQEVPFADLEFRVLPTESLASLESSQQFDAVFSNFGGLNCVTDFAELGPSLGRLLRPRGVAVLSLCSRVCLWEIAWFLFQARPGRAFRRIKGSATAVFNGMTVNTQYPTVRNMRAAMHPWFVLRGLKSIGLSVPPTYVERWASRHRNALAVMQSVDRLASEWPLLRVLGDHVLLIMERTPA